jgi:RNA polymerase sigma factor (sigma-70 family)
MSFGNHTSSQNFHQLYNDHHSWLEGWLRRKLGCTHQAQDLTHDTFIRILTASYQLNGLVLNEPRAFITTVANGVLVSWYKRQTLERAYLEALAMLPEQQVPAPEQRLIILETLYEMDRLLDGLPAKAKHAFLLSQIEGKKYEEIASQLNISLYQC